MNGINFWMLLPNLRTLKTGKITPDVYAVETGTVNFFVYWSEAAIFCIDTGFGKSLVRGQLRTIGIDPLSVTHVFLTHSDFDHAGGLALFENAQIYLSSDEEQMITGKKARMMGFVRNFRINRTYNLLEDNEVVTVGSIKIRAIATPGHTPGSMSYLVDESVLFVGDTFKLIDNEVRPLRQYINMDTESQKQSIRKLARLDHVCLACTAHSGCTQEFAAAIRSWKVSDTSVI
jgi:hydroxyacylglutathione hydrolase